jgi:hypothetical protein
MILRLSFAALAAVPALATPVHAAEPIATGLAIYDIDLGPGKDGGIGGISGTMSAKLVRDCDAYLTDASLDAEITGPDGTTVPLSVVSNHRETPDGLEFEVKTSLADVAVDAARGVATRGAGGISVAIEEPEKDTATLDGDILFPVEMLEASIAAAKAGETFREFRTFDGTGMGQEVWTVSVLITPAGEATDEDEAMFAAGLGFGDMARWRMAISYFPPGGGGEQMPAFSTSMVVYENGFAQAAVYDLGQFAMRLTLTEFQPIPPKPCP